jgi:hypothetical protein
MREARRSRASARPRMGRRGHAGQLLVSAGQDVERLRGEASFAALGGASPLPASSGKTSRHRLNYGGDRDANRALYLIAVCRLRYCPRTRAYAKRRAAEGKSKAEILRCLKRYIARQTYHTLRADPCRRPPTTATPRHHHLLRRRADRHHPTPHLTSIEMSPGELPGSVLRVGSENGNLVRRGWPARGRIAAYGCSGMHFRVGAEAFPKRLWATASVLCGKADRRRARTAAPCLDKEVVAS